MKYFEKDGQHWYVSDNKNCPCIMIDKTGEQALTSIAGKIHDLNPQDWQDFINLLSAAVFHELETLPIDAIKHARDNYNQTRLQIDRVHNSYFDSLIQDKAVTDK